VSAEVELQMLEGSEFQTVGAAVIKPRKAKVVRTHVTLNKLESKNITASTTKSPVSLNKTVCCNSD